MEWSKEYNNYEWSKDKTLKLIELLQLNANLWNPSLCDTRRDKQKRKEELRGIAEILRISVFDATKKIQHLRTQYNRESAREARANSEGPNNRYVSNWYAYEYLHFMKDSNKPYRVLQSEEQSDINGTLQTHTDNSVNDCKLDNLSPPPKITRSELLHSFKPEIVYPTAAINRDEFTVFGEYVANELRSLKGEKNLLVAKKKIQDVIFEVKMGLINEPRAEQGTTCTVYTTPATQSHSSTIHNGKIYTTPIMSTIASIEPLSTSHTPPTTGISEIIINGACHYSTFKVDEQ
ncbi:uncharacterized protein LOC113399898 [Vanessa tameamea]|uniref:Uncharacterized protein LOC113399898 n=1 Tax=Vanessa tameamea TaxID=334116 RepID=A0A8B8ID13_VANTA